MKIKTLIAGLAVAVALPIAASAATLSLTLDDTLGNVVNVVDGGAGDADGVANGTVTYIGSVGAFVLNITTATSSSPDADPATLTLTDSTVAGAGTLVITATDDGFAYGGASEILLKASQTNLGNELVSYDGEVSDANGSTMLSIGPLVGNTSDEATGSRNVDNPFALTLSATIIRTASDTETTQFNAALTVSPVPVPAAGLLLLGGLGGLVAMKRRKKA